MCKTSTEDFPMDRAAIRARYRALRQSLSATEQQDAASDLTLVVMGMPSFQQSKNIALYTANDGEIDPSGITEAIWQTDKSCYLPVLDKTDKNKMHFQLYTPETKLVTGRFNICEPEFNSKDVIAPEALDLVFMPLTAFDIHGNRLGMGGGFYDRAFSFVETGTGPTLIGLAHDCQKVDQLPIESWDIPLTGIATNRTVY